MATSEEMRSFGLPCHHQKTCRRAACASCHHWMLRPRCLDGGWSGVSILCFVLVRSDAARITTRFQTTFQGNVLISFEVRPKCYFKGKTPSFSQLKRCIDVASEHGGWLAILMKDPSWILCDCCITSQFIGLFHFDSAYDPSDKALAWDDEETHSVACST